MLVTSNPIRFQDETRANSYFILLYLSQGNDEWKRLEPFTAIERSPPTCEILNYVITVEKQLRCVNPAMTLPKQTHTR